MICELEGSDLYVCIESFQEFFMPIPDEKRIHLDFLELPEEATPLSAKLQTRHGSKLSVDFILSVVPKTSDLRGIDVAFFPSEETDIARLQRIDAKVRHDLFETLLGCGPIREYYGCRNSRMYIKLGPDARW